MYGPMKGNVSHSVEMVDISYDILYELGMIKMSINDFVMFTYIMSQMPLWGQ
jgi:hypothetical protein